MIADVMHGEMIWILIPFVGIWLTKLVRVMVDQRFRKLLERRGLDPNPHQLEVVFMFHPVNYWKTVCGNLRFRRGIHPSMGRFYSGLFLFELILYLLFMISVWIVVTREVAQVA